MCYSDKLTVVQLYMSTSYQPGRQVLQAFSDVVKHFFFIFWCGENRQIKKKGFCLNQKIKTSENKNIREGSA